MKVAVLGSGSWGTALSQVAACKGHKVSLLCRKPEVASSINDSHVNPRYLSDQIMHRNITATCDIDLALLGADCVVVVTPSSIIRKVASELGTKLSAEIPVIICSKGVEEESGLLPIEVFEAEIGNKERLAVLSGPNHAEEVMQKIFSATVIASESKECCDFFQEIFATDFFRTYISDDPFGVELCAAFKNVIAIAVGISYGIGMGDNTAALLMTRGQAEMSRLVSACSGNPITCMGLAGTGDLIATCTSPHSRNRKFGELIARGGSLEQFVSETHMVVEGAYAAQTLRTLALMYKVELPITDVVYSIVWEGVNPKEAVRQLAARPLSTEFYGI